MKKYPPSPKKATAQTVASNNIIAYGIFRFHKGMSICRFHELSHTFATNLVNGIKQPFGTIKSLTPRQVADLLGHSTSDITEMYYVKRNDDLLNGITNGFEI